MWNKIYQGSAKEILKTFPDESIDCLVTSPPYWGLRAYGTNPQVWDGDTNCEHIWGDSIKQSMSGGTESEKVKIKGQENFQKWESNSNFCCKCGAWRGELGLEPTFELYISHLLQIFTEVKRVLKKTGTCWVNLGDTYAGSNGVGWKETIENTNRKIGGDKANTCLKKDMGMKDLVPAKSLCCIPDRFKIAMVDSGWICRNEIIWYKRNCLNGGTVLYAKTQKGVMPSTIKDLVRLRPETVQLWDGKKWQKVKEWVKNNNPQDIKDITLRNGETINCTGDHLFPLATGEIKPAKKLKSGDVIKNTAIPEAYKDVHCIPDSMGWFLGIYLAEGSLGCNGSCIQIAAHTKERIRLENLQHFADWYGAKCIEHYKQENSATFNIYSKVLVGIIKTYISGNNAKNKRLTNAVWQRNNKFLSSLLTGYLEGDGHYEPDNNRYRLNFTRNNYLARDLRLLCARLGYGIRLQKGITKLNDKLFKVYHGEIRADRSEHRNTKSDYQIVKISKGKKNGGYWDIVLEQEPHLFASHSGLLIHNCMPSSASDRFTVDFEKIFFFSKQGKYYFEQMFEETLTCDDYIRDRDNSKLNNTPGRTRMAGLTVNNYTQRNMRTVWQINTQPFKEAHFAVFPPELPRRCITAGCPKEGVVLDPFMGSGTTALVAKQLNRNWVGIELSEDYCKMAQRRIDNEPTPLF